MIFGSTGNFVCTIDYRVVSLEKIKFSHTTIDDVLEVADSYSFPPFICLKQTPMLFFLENELGVYNCNL